MSTLRYFIIRYVTSQSTLITANVCDSNAMEKQLYNARPEIIQQLVRLLHNDSEAGIWLKTIVLRTLRTSGSQLHFCIQSSYRAVTIPSNSQRPRFEFKSWYSHDIVTGKCRLIAIERSIS